MFSKLSKPDHQVARADGVRSARGNALSIISPDLRITGDLVCAGDIQIDGWIDGNTTGRHIHLGENAMVRGSVQGELVKVGGTVNGEIRADNVVLEKTARVTGDVLHLSLAIEQGAFLDGRCKRIDAHLSPTASEKPMMGDTSRSEDGSANRQPEWGAVADAV